MTGIAAGARESLPHLSNVTEDMLAGKPVPPAIYTRHARVTPANVYRFYPNHASIQPDRDGLAWDLFG